MFSRVAVLILSAGMLFAGATSIPDTSSAAAMPPEVTLNVAVVASVSSATDRYEARIVTLVNLERTRRGLRALRLSSCADNYSERWSARMAVVSRMSHQAQTPILRACHARLVGENVAYGNVSADQMMSMWMHSPGHRANILKPAFTHLGVAAVRTSSGRWWGTQNFATL